ncbi:MAG: DUF1080 domain-containing protein [Bacteroidales bacterium]|nr:DUF1080 domain-containing protein [Bacteroidales bacterium]
MKKQIFALIFCAVSLISYCQHGHQNGVDQNSPPPGSAVVPGEGEGWVSLFDGNTPNGWRGFGQSAMPGGWTVEDGCLVTSGQGGDMGGDIITAGQYEDFDLYLEWAISPGGNSGIFFHVLENGYPSAYATGPEYQIIDDSGFPEKLEEWQQAGANYAMHPAVNKTLKPAGDFNSSRILVSRGHVEHWLNGVKIVEYQLWTDEWKEKVRTGKWKDYPAYGLARKGHIGLQDHGSPVRFRNIRIKDLTEAGQSLFNGADLQGWKVYGAETWKAENGQLVCESGPDKGYGYLATVKPYRDFILRLEFMQESNGNSGVFFRSALNGTDITGWQAEVAPKGNGTGGIYESGGRGWLCRIPVEKESVLNTDGWNEMVISVEGDRVITWLNNEMMCDLTDENMGKGNGVIALQVHDGGGIKVRWRNIFINEL